MRARAVENKRKNLSKEKVFNLMEYWMYSVPN